MEGEKNNLRKKVRERESEHLNEKKKKRKLLKLDR